MNLYEIKRPNKKTALHTAKELRQYGITIVTVMQQESNDLFGSDYYSIVIDTIGSNGLTPDDKEKLILEKFPNAIKY